MSEASLGRLHALGEALARAADPQPLLERVLDEAIALSGAERGLLILDEDDAREAPRLWVRAARNLDGERLLGPYGKFSRGVVREALEGDRTVLVADAGAARWGQRPSVRRLRLRAVLCTPLRLGGRPRGALCLDHRFVAGRFGAQERRLVELVAALAGLALDGQRAREARVRGERELESLRSLHRRLAAAADELEPPLEGPAPTRELGFVGRSAAAARLRADLRRAAASDAPVLLTGESGTGKELAARALHGLSARRGAPFVAVNCAAIPEPLLESELFGHRRGAWTGADRDRPGLLRAATGGTLFLDEVGDTSPAMQAKLLRALQEGEVRPVGGEQPVAVDVRVVAATHRDLGAAVAEGWFRGDLYYRLAVLPIRVPALRERPEDVRPLAEHFLASAAGAAGRGPRGFTAGAVRALEAAAWPGNVRQLQNVVTRAHALAQGRRAIAARDLEPARPAAALVAADDEGGLLPLDALERRSVARALARTGGDVRRAAELLGIHRSTLYRKLARLGLRAGPGQGQ